MKMHKIYGVDKNICTAEQKIAYNYAFSHRTWLEMIYKSDNTEVVKSEAYQDVISLVAKCLKDNGTDKKYNIDAIIHCLRNGIENYMKQHSILNSYEEIGKTFVCLYGIE